MSPKNLRKKYTPSSSLPPSKREVERKKLHTSLEEIRVTSPDLERLVCRVLHDRVLLAL